MSATSEMSLDEMVRLINPERVAEIVVDAVDRGFELTDEMVTNAAVQSLQEQRDIAYEMVGVRREDFKHELARLAFYA